MLRRAKRLLISPRTAEWKSWGLPRSGSRGGEGNHGPVSQTAVTLRTFVWCRTVPYHTIGSPPLQFVLAD
jgi:hypothetical protein